jgi:hypothetical protein
MKELFWPQYLVEPPYVEGEIEEEGGKEIFLI